MELRRRRDPDPPYPEHQGWSIDQTRRRTELLHVGGRYRHRQRRLPLSGGDAGGRQLPAILRRPTDDQRTGLCRRPRASAGHSGDVRGRRAEGRTHQMGTLRRRHSLGHALMGTQFQRTDRLLHRQRAGLQQIPHAVEHSGRAGILCAAVGGDVYPQDNRHARLPRPLRLDILHSLRPRHPDLRGRMAHTLHIRLPLFRAGTRNAAPAGNIHQPGLRQRAGHGQLGATGSRQCRQPALPDVHRDGLPRHMALRTRGIPSGSPLHMLSLGHRADRPLQRQQALRQRRELRGADASDRDIRHERGRPLDS